MFQNLSEDQKFAFFVRAVIRLQPSFETCEKLVEVLEKHMELKTDWNELKEKRRNDFRKFLCLKKLTNVSRIR